MITCFSMQKDTRSTCRMEVQWFSCNTNKSSHERECSLTKRLKTVEIDRLDFRACVKNRDAQSTFLYLIRNYERPKTPLYTAVAGQASVLDLFGSWLDNE